MCSPGQAGRWVRSRSEKQLLHIHNITSNGDGVAAHSTPSNRQTRRSVVFTVLLAVALLAFIGPAAAAQDGGEDSIDWESEWGANNQSPGTVDIAAEPAEFETAPDNVSTYEVVVYGATNGITGYDNIEIVLEDTRTVELGADSNTTVTFANGTGDVETVLFNYSVTVATSDDAVDGELAV